MVYEYKRESLDLHMICNAHTHKDKEYKQKLCEIRSLYFYLSGVDLEYALFRKRYGKNIENYFTPSVESTYYALEEVQDATRIFCFTDIYHQYIQEKNMLSEEIHGLIEHIIEKTPSPEIQQRMLPSIMENINHSLENQDIEMDLYITHTVLHYQLHRKKNPHLDLPSLSQTYPAIRDEIRSSMIRFIQTHQIKKADVTPMELFSGLDDITLYRYMCHYKHNHQKLLIHPKFDEEMYGYFGWKTQLKALSQGIS